VFISDALALDASLMFRSLDVGDLSCHGPDLDWAQVEGHRIRTIRASHEAVSDSTELDATRRLKW
jgi:hypothetical protein